MLNFIRCSRASYRFADVLVLKMCANWIVVVSVCITMWAAQAGPEHVCCNYSSNANGDHILLLFINGCFCQLTYRQFDFSSLQRQTLKKDAATEGFVALQFFLLVATENLVS